MSEQTWVYGLSYPDPGVFYVGISCNPHARWSQHWSCKRGCTSSIVISQWKPFGRKFDTMVFGSFDERLDALRLERALIDEMPGLVNDPVAALSRYWWPVDDRDAQLLSEAYERVGWTPLDVIDTSGEYVDERYDDLDLIEPP